MAEDPLNNIIIIILIVDIINRCHAAYTHFYSGTFNNKAFERAVADIKKQHNAKRAVDNEAKNSQIPVANAIVKRTY